EASALVTIEFATAAHHRAARAWLDRLADQRISYTDAVSFAVLEATGGSAVMSFDHDFELAGVSLWWRPHLAGRRARGRGEGRRRGHHGGRGGGRRDRAPRRSASSGGRLRSGGRPDRPSYYTRATMNLLLAISASIVASAVLAFVARQLRQPLLLGYIVAG